MRPRGYQPPAAVPTLSPPIFHRSVIPDLPSTDGIWRDRRETVCIRGEQRYDSTRPQITAALKKQSASEPQARLVRGKQRGQLPRE
jgi:hypothetical protein